MRFAFINAQRVLTAHGCMEANGDDERISVPEDFDLAPGRWREHEGEWIAYKPPVAVPQSVTMRQARLALLAAGKLADVASAISALPVQQREAAQIEWDYAATVERTSPFLQQLAGLINLDDQELDDLFTAAAEI